MDRRGADVLDRVLYVFVADQFGAGGLGFSARRDVRNSDARRGVGIFRVRGCD